MTKSPKIKIIIMTMMIIITTDVFFSLFRFHSFTSTGS